MENFSPPVASPLANRERLEEALWESEARYRDLIENAHDLIQSVASDGRFLFVNRAWLDTLGYTQAELRDLTLFDIIHPDSRSHCQLLFSKILAGQACPKVQATFVTKDGREIVVEGNVTGRYQSGRVIATHGFFRDVTARKQAEDVLQQAHQELERRVAERTAELRKSHQRLETEITERKQAEDALRDSEERLALAVKGTDDGLWDWNVLTGTISYSLRYKELLGYAEDEFPPLFASWASRLHPEDRSRTMAALRAHLERREPYDFEFQLQTKGGVYRWFQARGQAIWDATGKPTRMAGSIRDITDRKQMEITLRQGEERFRSLSAASPIGIYQNDVHGNCVYTNKRLQEMAGLTLSDSLGSGWTNTLVPEDKEAVRTAWQTCVQEQREFSHEFRWLRPDGTMRWVHSRAARMHSEAGQLLGYVGTTEDITERKLAEAALQRSHNELEQRVQERTVELAAANSNLTAEIAERKQAEEALRASEEKFSKAFRASPVPLSISSSTDGRYIEVNDSFCQATGYRREELVGHTSTELNVWPNSEDRAKVLKTLQQQGTVRGLEAQFQKKSGELGVILLSLEPIALDDEPCLLGVSNDITERIQAEAALRASEERWQLALRGSSDGIWDWNPRTNVVFFSTRWKEMLGFSENEISNHLEEWANRVHPEDMPQVQQNLADHFAQKTPFYVNEHRVLCKDGTYKWILDRGQALWDADGQVLRMVGSHTDIQARKEAEAERLKLTSLVENSRDFIGLATLEGNIVYINNAGKELVGLESDADVQKTTIFDYVLPEDVPEFHERILPAVRQQGFWKGEGQMRHWKGDSPIPIETHGFFIHDAKARRPVALAMVGHDITERKRAEEMLQKAYSELELRVQERTVELTRANTQLQVEIAEREQAEEQVRVSLQEKEVLLKEIHHRVKNNLQVISSLLYLQADQASESQTLQVFEDSQHRIRSMALIHEKLYQAQDLSRVDFREYARSLIGYLSQSYGLGEETIALKIDTEQVLLRVDKAIPCGLILNELASNALKHAFPQGRTGELCIDLQAEADGQVMLRVRDDGVGFPHDVDFRHTPSLGLQLVQTFTKQLRGTITLHHEGATAFEIRFPV